MKCLQGEGQSVEVCVMLKTLKRLLRRATHFTQAASRNDAKEGGG